jgi:uncharacterized protein
MVITLEELAWLDRCRRRVWLDAAGDASERTEPALDARSRSDRAHVRRVIDRMAGVTNLAALAWPERVAETRAAMERGEPLIGRAALETAADERLVLRGTPHLLRYDGTHYTPIHIRLHAEPTRWDRAHLDALRWLAGAAQEIPPPFGELWLGARGDGPAHVFTRRVDASDIGALLAQRHREVIEHGEPPLWFDSEHCPFCHWHDACDRAALDQQDLVLIPPLRRPLARALRERGVQSVPQVAALEPSVLAGLPQSDDATGRRIAASARALLTDAPVPLVARPNLSAPAGALFLDVEADPLTREPWAVGWLTNDGQATAAVVARGARAGTASGMTVMPVASVAEAWMAAAEAATATTGAVLHWGDAEGLLLARGGGAAAQAALTHRLYDLHAALTTTVALPIPRLAVRRSASLKTVAGWLGYAWPHGADHWAVGWDSYRAWRAALAAGETDALHLLAPALAYLRADLVALAVVWGWYRT